MAAITTTRRAGYDGRKPETMENIHELAERVYSLNPYEAQDNDTTPADIAETIRTNPTEVIKYLLDIIDELQA